jgi:DNA polymerase-1
MGGEANRKPVVSVVLVDFSNYVFACWFPALSAQKADPKYDPHEVLKTNLMGKLGTMQRTMNEIGMIDPKILFVEDRKSKRKYELWPSYKANRPPLEHDPRPEAKEFLKSQGYTHFSHSPDNEADDAIASMVHNVGGTFTIVIASSDKDLWQLIRPNVDVWSTTKDSFVTQEMIFKEFGVQSPVSIPIVKALWGDSGDNVPNSVPRMQKQLEPIANLSNGDIKEFWKSVSHLRGTLSPRCVELLQKGEAQVNLNWQLVKLDEHCEIVAE